ncbi:MAG: hypothetical protein HY234_09770 [Acidobacteria bacterium]|nr:hypothetical protein [Acidobacteriota bacterium]MBI3663323.1 hypothetical protein [Acidobacteriota bacterium]
MANQLDESAENLRAVTLVLLDVAANQMAIRKLLYDAGLATEESFVAAYRLQYDQQLGVYRESLKAADVPRLRRALRALSETPHII